MYPETPIIKLSQMSKSLLCIYPMYIDNKSGTHCTMFFLGGSLTGQRQRRGEEVGEEGSGGEKEEKNTQNWRNRPSRLLQPFL